jgi:glycosyltransferase involved in cell wall biosynthesis
VATDIAGNRDIVIDGENGRLVRLNDAAAMRRALVEVVSDEALYLRMSESARQSAERYTWDTVGQDFEQVYARVATGDYLSAAATAA